MSFKQFNLDPRLLQAVGAARYTVPTPIQLAAIPPAMAGHDLIGTAQTGTGKTAAFVLPILQRLLQGPRNRARALVITPTRELAEQIHTTFQTLGRQTGLRSATIYGGVGMAPQEQALRQGVEILVACPGRLLDHLGRGTARLGGLEVVVLDEADRMFDMGFLPDVRRILGQLPARRQTLLFSATFPPEIEQLAAQSLQRPQRIAVGLVRPPETVAHALYPVAPHLKTRLVLALLAEAGSRTVLIFTRTKHRATRLAQQIQREGHRAGVLHSNRSQGQRQAALDAFRAQRTQILVATDIAARGIDVELIDYVINFDIPDTVDAYIHRVGRTGRAEQTGEAFTLVTPEDAPQVREIERVVGRPLRRLTLAGFDYDAPAPVTAHAAPARGRGSQAPASRAPASRAPASHAPNSRPPAPPANGRPAASQPAASQPAPGHRAPGHRAPGHRAPASRPAGPRAARPAPRRRRR